MNIEIVNAYANNLKNTSLSIPHHCITGFTGVSGSGKSTLLKNIISSAGSLNFSRLKSKTIQNALVSDNVLDVHDISNLPQTLFIEIVNHVANSASTLSTISGIHEVLRDLFSHVARTHCLCCGTDAPKSIFPLSEKVVEYLIIDIEYDKNYLEKVDAIQSIGKILTEKFYDREGSPAKTKRTRSLASITVSAPALTESKLKGFSRTIRGGVLVKAVGVKEPFNPLIYTLCLPCLRTVPRLAKSRFSFNVRYTDGGGACRHCQGTGKQYTIDFESLIVDSSLSIFNGGLLFLNEKGIKYTTVTEKFINAFCEHRGIDSKNPINKLKKNDLKQLFGGTDEIITFSDRVGGKKGLVFEGVIHYLISAFQKNRKREPLASVVKESECPNCNGTRVDPEIATFKVHDASIQTLLEMSIEELHSWVKPCLSEAETTNGLGHLVDLEHRLSLYKKVSCSYLHLNRQSSTLSGGELQRIRLCRMLNSNIRNICYLLDEPSSGLHYNDIESMAFLFREICDRGNTLIIIEHNKKLLSACDHVVELGPGGGPNGGQLIFSGSFADFLKSKTSTAKFLLGESAAKLTNRSSNGSPSQLLNFSNVRHNNLKNLSFNIPKNQFTTICGVSGSGKSSLIAAIKNVVSAEISEHGFTDLVHLKQAGIKSNKTTNVAGILTVENIIAKLYAEESEMDAKAFKSSSLIGKCPQCKGKGFIAGPTGEKIDVCDECQGACYGHSTLSLRHNGLSIFDTLNMPLSELSAYFPDKKVVAVSKFSEQLGIGYLTLSRAARSLSKGEYQRVVLTRLLVENSKGCVCFLDEPSKGLHYEEVTKLINLIRKLADDGNTIIAVEHNPDTIAASDYTIELGPGSGKLGGTIIYTGSPQLIKNTPTAIAISDAQSEIAVSNTRRVLNETSFFINIENKKKDLKQNAINYLAEGGDTLLELSGSVEADFLDVAIQGGASFLRKKTNSSGEVSLPMLFVIDFSQGDFRYETSLYSALNVSTHLIKKLSSSESFKPPLRYVFDDKSLVGKCPRCHGKGMRDSLSRDLFIDGASLSKQSIRFLKNSTNFKEASVALRESAKISLNKDVSSMTQKEKNALFDGVGDRLIDKGGMKREWKGLIEHAILNYKYFPDKKIGATFPTQKKKVVCPFCRGKMLDDGFDKHTVWGLTYSDWMSLPISTMLKKSSTELKNSKLGICLAQINEFAKEEVRLASRVGDYSPATQGIIKMASLYYNNIYGSAIILRNVEALSPSQSSIVDSVAQKWKESNIIITAVECQNK